MPFPHASDDDGWDALCADDRALAAGVAALCSQHRLDAQPVRRYGSGSVPVYAIGDSHVLKLFPPPESVHAAVEARTLAAVHGALSMPTPQLVAADTLDGWHWVLMSQLQGETLVGAWPTLSERERDAVAEQLGTSLASLHAIDSRALGDFTPQWQQFLPAQRASAVECQRARRLDPYWRERISDFLDRWMPSADPRRSLLHTEVMREHLLVSGVRGTRRLSGLFDFEPAMLGAPEYEFASVGLFVACGDARTLRHILLAYGYRADQLDGAMQCRLMAYAMLHRYSNLRWYLERLPAQGAATFEELAARWWPLGDASA